MMVEARCRRPEITKGVPACRVSTSSKIDAMELTTGRQRNKGRLEAPESCEIWLSRELGHERLELFREPHDGLHGVARFQPVQGADGRVDVTVEK